jgi:hypothetical protein
MVERPPSKWEAESSSLSVVDFLLLLFPPSCLVTTEGFVFLSSCHHHSVAVHFQDPLFFHEVGKKKKKKSTTERLELSASHLEGGRSTIEPRGPNFLHFKGKNISGGERNRRAQAKSRNRKIDATSHELNCDRRLQGSQDSQELQKSFQLARVVAKSYKSYKARYNSPESQRPTIGHKRPTKSHKKPIVSHKEPHRLTQKVRTSPRSAQCKIDEI